MLRAARTENGLVRGLPAADPRITVFRGVPFAAPPVGALRWRAPQPAENWEGERKCFTFAPISIQRKIGGNPDDIYTREWNVDPDLEMSEDCLYLNVWTPAKTADEKLPVFVWYFGGGLMAGNTQEMEFDGERLARRGVIVVTVNYRLGPFGFLCHPALTAEDPEFHANFGFLDQRLGTLWVKRNIAAFGGDPENITIGGQSSGGGSVMIQVASPLNAGLFQKAICDSGVEQLPYHNFFGPYNHCAPLSQREKEGEAFFDLLGVKTLEEARALDAKTIQAVNEKHFSFFGGTVDEKLIFDASNDLYMRNQVNRVPMLFGHTGDEYSLPPKAKDEAELRAFAAEYFGADAEEFLSLAKGGSFEERLGSLQVQHQEYSMRLFAEAKAKTGDDMPFWYWVFDPEMPGWDHPGTFHSSDLWFFFETLAKCWRPFTGKHYDLARRMCNYWANFIKTGDPNGKDADGTELPLWKPYTKAQPCRMHFEDSCFTEEDGPNALLTFLVRKGMEKFRF